MSRGLATRKRVGVLPLSGVRLPGTLKVAAGELAEDRLLSLWAAGIIVQLLDVHRRFVWPLVSPMREIGSVRAVASGGTWSDLEAFWPAEEMVRNRGRLSNKIAEIYEAAHPNHAKASTADKKTWRESLYEVATALKDVGLGQVYVFVEYRVHPTMNPIDVVLAGQHPDGGLSFAAVELKQWGTIERPDPAKGTAKLCAACKQSTTGELCEDCAIGCVYAPFYRRHTKHPAVQVKDNLEALKRHHSMFDDRYVHLMRRSLLAQPEGSRLPVDQHGATGAGSFDLHGAATSRSP